MTQPVPGQRWVSDTEPELGLGIVLKVEYQRVEMLFPAANELRQYALKTAPLRRVEFKEGDRIQSHAGEEFVVNAVEEKNGLLIYQTDKRPVPEAELSDAISFSKPDDRLFGGQVDDFRTFELRMEALQRRCKMRQSPVRGYLGGRVDLIPHQMSIAGDVASRFVPRVLLADEVGLGKTIEACLILHRLHLTGRAERVLILLPEPLVHQWFVELLRRFNLMFSIYDADRCDAIESDDATENPFLESTLVLTSIGFLSSNEQRREQALAAGWDLVVVDEAHHLEWSPAGASAAYQLVERLAAKTPGLLLLTATPQQLGPEGHFARLRLLDPDRYADLAQFLEEADHYEQVAQAVDRLVDGKALSAQDVATFGKKSERIRQQCEELTQGKTALLPSENDHDGNMTTGVSSIPGVRAKLIKELLDEFGIGRVMFRNTRAALTGFPERRAMMVPLKGEVVMEAKVKWLATLLKKLKEEKVLLICRTRERVEELHEALQHEINVAASLFHEGLTLLQRDRNAASFAEEDGARILLCSEIGSEGRNFQFAHHLVLFDLPDDPELLEQRIGRLDRIGQTSLINIHVPYMKGTSEEALARWYHEGLNAFEKNPHGATEMRAALKDDLDALRETFDAKKLTKLIGDTIKLHAQVTKKLERGHDRLLELNSHRPEQAAGTIHAIRVLDEDHDFEEFFIRVLEHFGVEIEDHGNRAYVFKPGHLLKESLPTLTEEGMFVTFDRTRALSREDMGFISWDHPLVRGALDQLIGGESGNSSFAIWKGGKEAMLLEFCFVVECVAASALHADRFLPATPIRMVVDHAGADHTADEDLKDALFQKGDVMQLLDKPVVKRRFLPAMQKQALELAEVKMQELISVAVAKMSEQLQDEIARLEDLREINDHVRPDEIEGLRKQKAELHTAISSARLRMDALRLILRTK